MTDVVALGCAAISLHLRLMPAQFHVELCPLKALHFTLPLPDEPSQVFHLKNDITFLFPRSIVRLGVDFVD